MANDIGGVWRTIGGRRVFIKDGQDLASAMKESGKFKSASKGTAKKQMTKEDAYRQAAKELGYKRHTSDEKQNREIYERAQKIIKEHPEITEYENAKTDAWKQAAKELGYKTHTSDEKAYREIYERAEEIVKDKKLLAQIQEETDSMAYKELLGEYNAGKVTTADLEDTLKTLKKFNGDNDDYEYNLYKQAKENPDSINPMTEWSTDWEDLDKKFKDRYAKENSKYKYSVDGQKITEAEFKAEYDKQKKLGNIDKDMTYDDYKQGIVDDRNSNVRSLKNELMTAEQLKGKDREEQKEINKQYLKEQNKLAQEKNDANFAKEWYEGTKKTEHMAKENLERAKRNGASVEDLSNRTKQVHELELETQKAQEHANKMSARANSNNLENKYKISKTSTGKEYIRTISPYDETEYAYAEKRNDSWYVKDPTKKTGSGSPQTHIYNDVNEARAKMEEINNRIKGNSVNSGKNYEGVTYNNYKKEEVNEASVDHRNEAKTSSDVMNANIRNAYREYKKKHLGSKISFSKFKDNYKS